MRLELKIILICTLIVFTVLQQEIPTQAESHLMLEIRPSRFEVLVEPGRRAFYSLKFKNNGSELINLTAKAQDWDLDENLELVLLDSDTLTESASTWFRFNPKNFSIDPGTEQILRFAIAPPPNARPGEYRTCLVLTTDSTMTMQDGMTYRPTFVVMVYVNIPAIQRVGSMTEVKVTRDESSNYQLEGILTSIGNAHLRVVGRYSLMDQRGVKVQQEKLGTKVILPGRRDQFQIPLGQELEPGEYQVQLEWFYIPAFYMKGQLTEYPTGEKGMLKEFKFVIE